MAKRLFIISNRLPIQINKVEDQIKINVSSGGLIAAITSYIQFALQKGSNHFEQHYWIGAPCCGQAEWIKAKNEFEPDQYEYLPVFVNSKVYDHYYNGLSNSVIWPLFHYFPSFVKYEISYYKNYLKANTDFFEVVIRHAKEDDIIWIHDYHLLPLAAIIRERLPNVTIGFFLHIPFPSYELFRLMPSEWQHGILEGVSGADLIGFHTIDYASHFLKSVQMVLGADVDNNIVKYKNRLIKVDVFPISIDFNKFNLCYNDIEIAQLRGVYKQQFKGQKILFSVDRLDYTKGVFSRLKAYELFLKLYPEYVEKVVLIMVVVPSRDTISAYADRKKEIDELIGNLNSTIGTISWKPVVYQYTHVDFTQLVALYTSCNIALVTPLRDGMNLVAKEFVASRQDMKGVLLLSEMTGAAREFTEAMLINPNDTHDLAIKIKKGLEMDAEEQKRCLTAMQARLKQYDVTAWADDFFTQLDHIKVKQREFEFMFLDNESKMMITEKYRRSKKRLLLLDYDGTLVPYATSPEIARPSIALTNLLKSLAQNDLNTLHLISGRDSNTLEKWFGDIDINLIAEHGAKTKLANGNWRVDNHILTTENWKKVIHPLMELYVKRCPHTFIEEKEFSMVWHYRNAEMQQGNVRAKELFSELDRITQNLNVQVLTGNKIIEVRVKGIDKGYVVRNILNEAQYDFILACGDDNTDEDMFKILANIDNAYTIKIGDEASYARYNLYTSQMAVSLLSYLQNTFS